MSDIRERVDAYLDGLPRSLVERAESPSGFSRSRCPLLLSELRSRLAAAEATLRETRRRLLGLREYAGLVAKIDAYFDAAPTTEEP